MQKLTRLTTSSPRAVYAAVAAVGLLVLMVYLYRGGDSGLPVVGGGGAIPGKGAGGDADAAAAKKTLDDIGTNINLPVWYITGRDPTKETITSRTIMRTALEELRKTSKSQDKEDIHVLEHYYLGGKVPMPKQGLYLEMGALDGVYFSNTFGLEKVLGWHGLLLEGSPAQYTALKQSRPNNILVSGAVCSKASVIHFIEAGAVGGIIEFMPDSFLKAWHPKVDRNHLEQYPAGACFPLQHILKSLNMPHFHMFSLDLEGAEMEALKSLNFDEVTFDIIFVEADEHNPPKNLAVRNLLTSKGYTYDGDKLRSSWFVRSAIYNATKLTN